MGSIEQQAKKYRSRRIYVHAWQFWKGTTPPAWVMAAAIKKEDGRIFWKRGPVNAVEPNQGDWIVRDERGNVSVFTADEFQYGFEEDTGNGN